MATRFSVLAPLLLVATACQFDGSSDLFESDQIGDPAEAEPAPDPNPPAPDLNPPAPAPIIPFDEDTEDGTKLEGTYEDLEAMDDSAELIKGAIDNREEELDQRWFFDTLAAGQYELTFAALAFSPNPIGPEELAISYRVPDGFWVELFEMETGTGMTSYVDTINLTTASKVEIRAELDGFTPALVSYDDNGIIMYKVVGFFDNDEDSQELEPQRTLRADQVVLTAKP